MGEPTSEQFDQLAAAARSGTDESHAALWSATFGLARWWFLPDGNAGGPRIGVLDGKPFLLAFTSGTRARRQALAWGLVPRDAEGVDILAIPPQDVLQMRRDLERDGVFGIVFDQGMSGYSAPLADLQPILEKVRPADPPEEPVGGWYAEYRDTELRADLLGDGATVELQSEERTGFAQDEFGHSFLTLPRSDVQSLYAVNLVATAGKVRAGVVSAVGDRLRLAAPAALAGSARGWSPTDVGVVEAVLDRDEVQIEGLRTDLPPRPQDPPVIVQKVLTPQQTRACLDGELQRIFGFLSVLDDVVQWRTPGDIVTGLRLQFPGSPFSAQAESIAVLRFAVRDGTWRLRNRGTVGETPVFFLGPEEMTPVPAGAELQVFERSGRSRLPMRYAGLRLGWVPAG